jgi:hypothetical protein
MAEEKKKTAIVKRIFGWIWLGLLTLLILAALVYDAPWKVLALLLIILAACTALPRPARKWFWLSVAPGVVALIIWVFLPEDNGDWQPYTFDQELAALKAKYAVPDSENAAIAYNKLFQNHNEVTFYDNLPVEEQQKLPMGELWLSKDHPKIAEWLKDQQKTIDTLIEISQIEKCQFPMMATLASYEKEFDHRSKLRQYAFLLVSSANNDIAEDRIDAGLEKWLCLTQMAKHLYQQPTMWDFVVGAAIEAQAFKQLKRFMMEGQPSKEQVRLIADSLKNLENNWSLDFGRFIEYERLLSKNMLGLWYEINQKGKTRLSRDPTAAFKALFPQAPIATPTYWRKKLAKASVIIGWFFFPPTPQKVANIVDATYEKYYAMTDPNFDWSKKPPEVQPQLKLNYRCIIESLTNMSGQTYSRIHELYLKFLASRRGSRLLVAIKQYQIENGNWPANLDAIKSYAPAESFIDPVSGSQFEYEKHDSRFSLYGAAGNIWPK